MKDQKAAGESPFYNFCKAYKLVYERVERDLTNANRVALSPLEMMHRIDISPDGRLRLLDLAHSLVTSPSSVTRMMDKLVRQGFIIRRESEQDRRETFAYLTPEGKQHLDKGMKILRKSIEKHFESAFRSNEETVSFIHLMQALSEGQPGS
jgi:DNA-binding MarR family transcriptional regulator